MTETPPRYRNSSTIRRDSHDELETRFAGGHADLLDTSSTSLHLDAGDPKIRKIGSQIHLYHGDEHVYELERLSDIGLHDRVLRPHGQIPLSGTAKKLYKALTKAIDRKLFRLRGRYDCLNEYIRTGLTESEFEALPVIRADVFCPYYYKRSSSIMGEIAYNKIIPPGNEGYRRRVFCINVKREGALDNLLPDRIVVYLGGLHDVSDGGPSSLSRPADEETRKISTKYLEYRYDEVQLGPAGEDFEKILIASPFPKTWPRRTEGVNFALAKLRNGHFLYWTTYVQPDPGEQLCNLPLDEIPRAPFNTPADFKTWPVYEGDTDLASIFEGAWVLRGDRLVLPVKDNDYPEGVLTRLREGFFRVPPREVFPLIYRIEPRIKKAIGSLNRYGASMFGFDEDPDGTIKCDIEGLACYLKLSSECLLAFMGFMLSSYRYFKGIISFLLTQKGEGKFMIEGAIPVGPWMRGVVTETNSGLLYVSTTKKYYSYETINEVSWLSELQHAEITEKWNKKENLGKWLSYAG